MSTDRELDLVVVPAQTCFVGLPRALVHRWGDTSSLVLHLRWQGGEAHVGWGGSASASAGALEVPAALAEALGVRPPMRLRVCPVQVPVASAVSVQPESAADWEAVQQAADELEAQVLSQVLVVGVGQRLPLWLGRTTCIWLRVERSEPAAAAVRLGRGTELLVAPFVGGAPSAAATATAASAAAAAAAAGTSVPPVVWGRRRRLRVATAPPSQPALCVGVDACTLLAYGWTEGQACDRMHVVEAAAARGGACNRTRLRLQPHTTIGRDCTRVHSHVVTASNTHGCRRCCCAAVQMRAVRGKAGELAATRPAAAAAAAAVAAVAAAAVRSSAAPTAWRAVARRG